MSTIVQPSPAAIPAQPRVSMTSKEWVIPPRPKPGRKPATDTPPTKRKAQNRAAQRAFRERRAARVGELEELLDQQRDEHLQEQSDLKAKVHDLELDLQSFRSRCSLLESMLERERQDRMRAESHAEAMGRRHTAGTTSSEPTPVAADLRRGSTTPYHHTHRHSTGYFPASHAATPNNHSVVSTPREMNQTTLPCGKCSSRGPCSCVDELLPTDCGQCGFGPECKCLNDMADALHNGQDLKRSASPTNRNTNSKRPRSSESAAVQLTTTSQPSQFPILSEPSHGSPVDSSILKDSCGFCKDGTYCVCAEDAKAATADIMDVENTLAPITRQTHTPPPSDTDVVPAPSAASVPPPPPLAMEMTADGAVKLPPRKRAPKSIPAESAPSKTCGPNGPGSCAQCQADPRSGLFCRLMAANASASGSRGGGGCCGGKGASGGCCKDKAKSSNSTVATSSPAHPSSIDKPTLPSLPSLGLSCADAYQTLSSHRNFARAADDIGSWLPKLKMTPVPAATAAAASGPSQHGHAAGARPGQRQPGRMPMEVEAASIMSVLKDFDVRFAAGN